MASINNIYEDQSNDDNNGDDERDTCDIKFAPGIHFDPSDEEIMTHYLLPKLQNPKLHLHAMFEVDVYAHHPSDLTEMWRERFGRKEKNAFFVSPRTRKSKNTSRLDRTTRGRIRGHWRLVTGEDIRKRSNGETIGTRNSLDFYEGVQVKGSVKTHWKFCEYVRKGSDDQKFEDMALYKLYKARRGKPNENGEDDSEEDEDDEEEEEDDMEYAEFYRRCAEASEPKHGGSCSLGPNSMEWEESAAAAAMYPSSSSHQFIDDDHNHHDDVSLTCDQNLQRQLQQHSHGVSVAWDFGTQLQCNINGFDAYEGDLNVDDFLIDQPPQPQPQGTSIDQPPT